MFIIKITNFAGWGMILKVYFHIKNVRNIPLKTQNNYNSEKSVCDSIE